ncbi:gypsy type transposase [Tanacetum coccineum]|uniref:Gypsy type transposase n=1 Tax=Tanacetum coccineum TaxID=301880 RepID=A0ABQ4YDF3_9ASTR
MNEPSRARMRVGLTALRSEVSALLVVNVSANDLTDPAPTMTFLHLDDATVLSRGLAVKDIYLANSLKEQASAKTDLELALRVQLDVDYLRKVDARSRILKRTSVGIYVPTYPLLFHEKIKSVISKMRYITYHFNVVIQFWASCEGLLLTTSDQPFVCKVTYSGVNLFEKYRLNSQNYRYNVEVNKSEVERGDPMIINGPPATAFLNHLPELAMDCTSVHQLSPLLRYAFEECKFTSYFMLPVFDTSQSSSCAGVVECCMETDGLGSVLPMVKLALNNAGLSTFRVQECPAYKAILGLKRATDEMNEALDIVCDSHDLAISQVWIPYGIENHVPSPSSLEGTLTREEIAFKLTGSYVHLEDDCLYGFKKYYDTCDMLLLNFGDGLMSHTSNAGLSTFRVQECPAYKNHVPSPSSLEGTLTRQEFAFKLTGSCVHLEDDCLYGFKKYYDTCDMLLLNFGDGLVGKALQTYEPHFCRDLYNLPMRKDKKLLQLLSSSTRCSCLAIYLRSIDTGDIDYAFEFLWPRRSGIIFFKILEGNRISQIQKALADRKLVVEDGISSSHVKSKTTPVPEHRECIKKQIGRSMNKDAENYADPSGLIQPTTVKRNLGEYETQSDSNDDIPNQDDDSPNQDILIIKLEYADDVLNLNLPIPLATLAVVKKEINKSCKLNPETYKLKYLDEDEEWILMTSEEPIRHCIEFQRTVNGKPLALSWGRIPRLDFGVRVRKHVVRDAFCEKYHILDTVHPELPGSNQRIRNNPAGKIGVYIRFFDFANFLIPLSQFLVDVLAYFHINLSQLSVIAAAKVSHFEILCRVHGYEPTVGLFRRFYVNSKNKGWMSFSKRSDTAPVCYTKPLDSLKHLNDSFFWVDSSVFPLFIPWQTKKTLTRDPSPTAAEFSAETCDFLATHQALFRKFSEPFLCLVGISRYYDLDDNVYPTFLTATGEEMDLFAFIRHTDPTKVQIGERQIERGQVPLLDSTQGRVIPLANEDYHGDQNENTESFNEGGGGATQESHSGEADRAGQDEEATIVLDEEFQAAVADKPKGTRKKRKVVGGTSGSNLPPKKLREVHDTSGDAGASTVGKSLATLQGLLKRSTLVVEIGATTTATAPFVTSSVTLTPEREGGGHIDSVSGPNLRNQHPAERFVISSDSSPHSSTNAADAEVTSIVRSPIPPPPVMTAAVATTVVAGTSSAHVLGACTEPTIQSLFADSASPSAAGPEIAGPSDPHSTEISADSFYVSQEMDSETVQQIYVPKWNVINDSAFDDPEVCRSMIDQLAPPGFFSQLRSMDYDQLFTEFNVGAAHQTCLSAEVRLRSEYNFRERKKFERKCHRQTDLLMEKDAEIASLKAQLSLMEAEAAEAIHLYSQVSVAEAAKVARVSELNSLKERNVEGQVAALESAAIIKDTELASFNAQITKLTQDLSSFQLSCDELSIKAASFESERDGLVDQVSSLEGTCFGLRDQVLGYELLKEQYEAVQDAQVKILSNRVAELDFELMGMTVHLDKEFYPRFLDHIAARRWHVDRVVAGIDSRISRRGLAELESQKDASTCIMDSLCLEGPFAETPEVKEGALSHLLSISEAIGPLVDPLSFEKLVGEASTSGVPATTATTTALSVLVTTANVSSIPPISVADYEVLNAEPWAEASHSPKIIFE